MSDLDETARPVSLTKAAAVLGINRRTAYQQIVDGRFPVPVIRCGRSIRVPRAALNNLLGVS